MKLEHKTQKVISLRNFAFRMGRYGLFALLLICFSVGIGVIGYKTLGNLSWADSFHMACMILTGMGSVAELTTDKAKIFSSIFALYSGVVFLSIAAVFFTPIIHRLLHILHVENNEGEDR